MLIGEMLVRAGALLPADVDEAVSWQVLYGGRLGTNLLELGLVEERVLAETLGRQLSCEATFGEVELAQAIVQMIPRQVARRREMVPWRVEGKRLKVLCASPRENLEVLDEIGFRLAKLVRPVVAPEFRIHQCLRRYFDSSLPMRSLDFGLRPRRRTAPAPGAPPTDAADLIDDQAFADLYQRVIAAPQSSWRALDGEPAALATTDSGPAEPTPLAGSAPAEQELFLDASAILRPVEETEPEDLAPLDFPGALAAIGLAGEREQVARAVLRYARSKAARAVLLSIQRDFALGWDALGEGLSPEQARRIALPLTAPSAFRLVRESRSHYIGPLAKEPGNVHFLKGLGKQWPASAVLLPVLFRGNVVYILYVDNGHRRQVNPDIGELLILSQNITRSMEQLVAKRRAAR